MKKLVALVLTFLLILTGCSTVSVTKVKDDTKTDAIRFSSEYSTVKKDNVYKYSTYSNVMDTLKNKTGIIYLGFPSCALCKEITPILNEVAKEKDIKEVLYYNFKDMRDNNTTEYQELADKLSDYIKTDDDDDDGNKRIQAPTVIFVNKGNVVAVYIDTINSDSEEIMTDEEKNTLKQNFESLVDKMITFETTTSSENIEEAN